MKLINHLFDHEYPLGKGDIQPRDIVRAVVINDRGEIALTHLLADDMFGHRDYYELPGGGVEVGESKFRALERELQEEVGYQIKLIAEIGKVIDYYNLLNRENHNYYYFVKATKYVGASPTQNEKRLIDKLVWVSFQEARTLFNAHPKEGIAKLITQRELPIIIKAEQLYREKTLHE